MNQVGTTIPKLSRLKQITRFINRVRPRFGKVVKIVDYSRIF